MPSDDQQIVVELLPARHGDALLVRAVAEGRTTNILIDAGPQATYRDVLRPRLSALADAGECLHLFIITHIDADHIGGALAFLEDNGPCAAPSVIEVKDVWHNSYRHLFQNGATPSEQQATRVKQNVALRAAEGTGNISARQGSTLAAVLRRFGYAWNAAFGGDAVTMLDRPRRVVLDDGVSLTLLSPRPDDLTSLARLWRRELLSVGVPSDLVDAVAFEDAFERMIERESELSDDGAGEPDPISARRQTEPPPMSSFREDRSRPNASSISFLLEVGTKRALFLADAHPSRIAEGLRQLATEPIHIGAVKVSHHGSKKNTSPEICSLFRTNHALISTDGTKHGHPDIETLLWLVDSQSGVTLHFNYRTTAAEAISTTDLVQRYGHQVSISPLNQSAIVVL